MEAKTGGAAVVGGAVAVALGYLAVDPFGHGPSADVAPRAPKSSERTAVAPESYDAVDVFYATDRAPNPFVDAGGAQHFASIGLAVGLACVALAFWLNFRGRPRAAVVGAAIGGVLALAFILGAPLAAGWSRAADGARRPGDLYGGERGELRVGVCEVTVPRSHRVGEVERPSILRLELAERPDRHVMLQRVLPQADQEFFAEVRRRVQASPRRDAFVFVHGFNVSFESAALRTAQMAYDLGYEGAPIFYSWPSQAKPWLYTVDETNAAWSGPHLKQFLADLIRESEAESIQLVAHSMGTRVMTQAIRELDLEGRVDLQACRQLVLAAPDIDADLFREQIAPVLGRHIPQVTLYASSADEALAASKLVHGAARAGESNRGLVVTPGVETIDVEIEGLGILGHSYYGSNPLVLRDLAAVLLESRDAAKRPWLVPVERAGGTSWRFADGARAAALGGGEDRERR